MYRITPKKIIVAVFLLLIFTTIYSTPVDKSLLYHKSAKELVKRGLYNDASEYFDSSNTYLTDHDSIYLVNTHYLAYCYRHTQEYAKSIDLSKWLLYNTNDQSVKYAMYNNLGITYFKLRNYDLALLYYKLILKYTESTAVYNNLGAVYFMNEDYSKAIQYFRKSESLGGQVSTLSMFYSYLRLDSLDKATEYYNLLKNIKLKREHELDKLRYFIEYNIRVGDTNSTKTCISDLDNIYSKIDYGLTDQYLDYLLLKADCYSVNNNKDSAMITLSHIDSLTDMCNQKQRRIYQIKIIKKRIELDSNIDINDIDKLIETVINTYTSSVSPTAAFTEMKDVNDIFNTIISNMYSGYLKTNDPAYLNGIYTFAEFEKALLINYSLAKKQLAYKDRDFKKYFDKEIELRNEIVSCNDDLLQQIDLYEKLNNLYDTLDSKYKLQLQVIPVKADDAIKSLKRNQAIIQYTDLDSIYLVIVITKEGVHCFSVENSDELIGYIDTFKLAVSTYDVNIVSMQIAAKFINDAFIKPANLSSNINRLLLIPDGDISGISFAALVDSVIDTEEYYRLNYLVRKYAISYDFSVTSNHQSFNNHSVKLLYVSPEYNQGPHDYLMLREFKPFDNYVKRYYGTRIINDEATKGNVLSKLSGRYSLIHIATHGDINTENYMEPKLVFENDSNRFMYPSDIEYANLNANMVILNACYGGAGQIEHGDGMMSIARSFRIGRVNSVITSIWESVNISSLLIFRNLYKRPIIIPDKSLRKSQLKYLRTFDPAYRLHPKHWANYIIIGNSKPVIILNYITIFLCVVCLVVIIRKLL